MSIYEEQQSYSGKTGVKDMMTFKITKTSMSSFLLLKKAKKVLWIPECCGKKHLLTMREKEQQMHYDGDHRSKPKSHQGKKAREILLLFSLKANTFHCEKSH